MTANNLPAHVATTRRASGLYQLATHTERGGYRVWTAWRDGRTWRLAPGRLLEAPRAAQAVTARPTLADLKTWVQNRAHGVSPSEEGDAFVTIADGSILAATDLGIVTIEADTAAAITAAAEAAAAIGWVEGYRFSSAVDFPAEYGWTGRSPHRVLEAVHMQAAAILRDSRESTRRRPERCADCGATDELTGHMGCQYPGRTA